MEKKRIQPITRKTLIYLAVGLSLSALLTIVLTLLARQALAGGWFALIDNSVLGFVRHHLRNPLMDKIMFFVTFLGSFKFYLLVCPFILFFLWKWGHRRESIILLVCLLGGSLLNNLLKFGFKRLRPEDFFLILEKGYSFPSGHAMISVPFYGYLAYLYWRIIRRNGAWISGLALAVVAGIGFSRIYLGVHWFSDVLAGYLGGSFWLLICIMVLEVSHYFNPPKEN